MDGSDPPCGQRHSCSPRDRSCRLDRPCQLGALAGSRKRGAELEPLLWNGLLCFTYAMNLRHGRLQRAPSSHSFLAFHSPPGSNSLQSFWPPPDSPTLRYRAHALESRLIEGGAVYIHSGSGKGSSVLSLYTEGWMSFALVGLYVACHGLVAGVRQSQ